MRKNAFRIVLIFLSIAQISCSVLREDQRPDFGTSHFPGLENVTARISNRTFPSVFQAWNGAEFLNLGTTESRVLLRDIELPDRTLARHDLLFQVPEGLGLKSVRAFAGLNTDYTEESIAEALSWRKGLFATNPHMVVLAEIRYRDAAASYLPDHHVWWKRDWTGRKIPGWEEGGYYLLDYSNPDFQAHIAIQCLNVIRTGVVDGCMFDWWEEETSDRIQLLKQVRRTIGRDPLILVNAGNSSPAASAAYINGIFMEGLNDFWDDWNVALENLRWAEVNVLTPRINAVEAWYHHSRDDHQFMRAITTFVLTQSDGYVLFSDPNSLPVPDHLHDWYPFWDKTLGGPLSNGHARSDGGYERDFEKGTVVFNPPGNQSIWVEFDSHRTSLASRNLQSRFLIPSGDGDCFVREAVFTKR